eukprot:CAMPEP_0205821340 /NCGR_PEP_ID=MMETSP0206-20130828/6960_1 /ASSEMBLY_ACC=CAM_ASM_000279 /TAXON_ID=36767 /ORGANISM="Euplotes focardii, Strain TN1" /LENGTH=277 /DNA_ID=CAMNT_0053116751 /DNA_START=23 /DNA_END=856 /DNA_ORIENTATION=+
MASKRKAVRAAPGSPAPGALKKSKATIPSLSLGASSSSKSASANTQYLVDKELVDGMRSFVEMAGHKLDALVAQEAKADGLDSALIPKEWAANIESILFSEAMIRTKVSEMAAQISKDYQGKGPILVVGLLNGSFMFAADILREITVPYELDFMVVSSYGKGTQSSGSIKLKKDLSIDPAGRHVLIVEDLIDTGKTLAWIREHLSSKKCLSVAIATLLDKHSRRTANVDVKYVGYPCPDYFVVGYGMDFADQYRCLPFVGVLKPEAYAEPKAEEAAQ